MRPDASGSLRSRSWSFLRRDLTPQRIHKLADLMPVAFGFFCFLLRDLIVKFDLFVGFLLFAGLTIDLRQAKMSLPWEWRVFNRLFAGRDRLRVLFPPDIEN